ncbi:MAG: hypothetical protein HY747_08235, partial [Elusimicrobia bacterium]|nr:hypothetical protein [Elusimicrobiota bacterium]
GKGSGKGSGLQDLTPSHERGGFVSLVAGFIVALGALDVLIFSVWRLTKASLLVEPSPWALLVAALAILGNYQLFSYSACIALQMDGSDMKELSRSFRTSVIICALAFAGVMLGNWWPAADAIAAIIAAGLLFRPAAKLCLTQPVVSGVEPRQPVSQKEF